MTRLANLEGKIQSAATSLEASIREYSLSQKANWQKIPYLALMADGRSGYLDKYATAYYKGLWFLDDLVERGYYTTGIDLATGKIVHVGAWSSGREDSAAKESVLRIASDISMLDAGAIVKDLEEQGREKYGSYYSKEHVAKWEARRLEIMKEYGVKPVYTGHKRDKSAFGY